MDVGGLQQTHKARFPRRQARPPSIQTMSQNCCESAPRRATCSRQRSALTTGAVAAMPQGQHGQSRYCCCCGGCCSGDGGRCCGDCSCCRGASPSGACEELLPWRSRLGALPALVSDATLVRRALQICKTFSQVCNQFSFSSKHWMAIKQTLCANLWRENSAVVCPAAAICQRRTPRQPICQLPVPAAVAAAAAGAVPVAAVRGIRSRVAAGAHAAGGAGRCAVDSPDNRLSDAVSKQT